LNNGKIAVGAATTTIAEPVLWAAHQGGLGVIVGLGIGLISYLAAGEIEDLRARHAVMAAEAGQSDQIAPRRASGQKSDRAGQLAKQGRSLGYRLLVGRNCWRRGCCRSVGACIPMSTRFSQKEPRSWA
jgi:hypothetical protein